MASGTIEQLRNDIDTGRTRDKVHHADHAAVPLGADEEAAGTPLSREAVAIARAYEVKHQKYETEDGGVRLYIAAISSIGSGLSFAVWYLQS